MPLLAYTFLAAAFTLSCIPLILKLTFVFLIFLAFIPFWLVILLFALVLFLPASFFLGALQPIIVKKATQTLSTLGTEYGLLSAAWSVGSIAGVLIAGLYLISAWGMHLTLFFIVLIIWGTGFAILIETRRSRWMLGAACGLWLILAFFLSIPTHSPEVLETRETKYYLAQVFEGVIPGVGPARALFLDGDVHTLVPHQSYRHQYTDMIPAYRAFIPRIENVLVVGGGAYSIPKNIARAYPNATITVLEIDPEVTALAKRHFDLDSYPHIQTVFADPRLYLAIEEEKYDLIVIDAFNSIISPPWQLGTIEFFRQVREHLSSEGALVMNIIGIPEGSPFTANFAHTFAAVFPHSYAIPFEERPHLLQNIELIGTPENRDLQAIRAALSGADGAFFGTQIVPLASIAAGATHIFSDDQSSLERELLPLIRHSLFPHFMHHLMLTGQFPGLLKKLSE
jgi:spermidine synthase